MKKVLRFLGWVSFLCTLILVVRLALSSGSDDFGQWLARAMGALILTAVLLVGCDWRRGDG